MTAVDVDHLAIFDGQATAGTWGPVLRACAPPPPPPARWPWPDRDELRVQAHRYLREHPMLTVYEVARGLGLPHPEGSCLLRPVMSAMERDGEAIRHKGARVPGDRRTTVRWEAS